jgi:hypothetical protein
MKMPICSRCHRPLKDPYSIAVGMGPECRGGARRQGVKFPKPKFTVRGGKVVFDGVVGKVEYPPTATPTLPSPKRKPLLGEGKKLDEEEALVRRALRAARGDQGVAGAVRLLHDRLHDQDSPVTFAWCEKFVARVIGKINQEAKK